MSKNKVSNVMRDIVDELHKPARRNFKRRRVIVKGIGDLIQADLVEMIPYEKFNKGFRYILVIINVFSKFVWAFPIKRKTGKDVAAAIEKVLSVKKNIVKNIQTDNGTEFYNKEFKVVMKKYNINHYSTYSNLKASVVERVNRTLKNLMGKQFSLQGTYEWLSILPDIVRTYNSTKHSTINARPSDVNSKSEFKILREKFNHIKMVDPTSRKFNINDNVRISKYRGVFDKGYTPNWSNEIFKIKKVQSTYPKTYILNDKSNQEIKGGFYAYELQKVKHPDIYLVEKVIRKKGNKVLVKWLGFDSSHNSWISKDNIQ